jgi:outer membrane receptor protein involved in Fe transport
MGLSYDDLDEEPVDTTQWNPKFGIKWQALPAVTMRAAVFKTLTRALIADQTIEPTNIAGFNQFFDDAGGVKATQYGVGIDVHPLRDLYFGLEAFRRDLDFPVALGFENKVLEDWQEDQIRSYIYFTPHPYWSTSMEVRFDEFESHGAAAPDVPEDLDTVSVPFRVRFFHPSGFFAQIGETVVYQDLKRRSTSSLSGGSNSFSLVDAAVGYRLPQRRGILSLEARNLLDEKFSFQDDNFQNPSVKRISPFIPARTVVGRITLSF